MSDQTSDQQPDDSGTEEPQGTFVGGSFGKPSLKDSDEPTTASQIESEEDHTVAADAPAEVQESLDDSGSTLAGADAESAGSTQPPGERNEPV